jgi:D-beta-D-heptose 7-phosphate kinase/D-beta-D-heptose 1-phosphate adenosyltransferase
LLPALVGDPTRPTTTKVRIVTERNQQVARIDYEVDTEIKDEFEHRVIAEIQKHAQQASAIVISDYLKGCITRAVVQAAVAAAAGAWCPGAGRSEDPARRLLHGGRPS